MFIKLVIISLIGSVLSYHAGDTFSNCRKTRTQDSVDCTNFGAYASFRTHDGTCNNLQRKTQGAANTTIVRFLAAQYASGSGTPRGFPGFNSRLPTSNQVSQAVFEVMRENKKNSRGLSVLFMSFGQFMDHDMVLTPHSSCRVSDCSSSDAFKYPCFPIKFGKGSQCTPFGRSLPVCPTNPRHRGTREQINGVSSYLDLSMVYGKSDHENKKLRRLDGSGELKVNQEDLLPIVSPFNGKTCRNPGGCSLVGDARGDENIGLYSMHTIWVRHHNVIAKKLKAFNRHWDEETVYEMARQINGAVFQHIVYTEYLPFLIDLHPYKGYQWKDASIGNGFSTAAFRYGHSLVPNSWSILNKNFDEIQKPVPLQKTFFNTKQVRNFGIETTVFGLIGNQSQEVDNKFAHGIARKLFVPFGKPGHVDLAALNIQRGRDHGIPTFTKWRRACGLRPIRSFRALKKIMPRKVAVNFRKIYRSVHHIDLFAAGIVESSTRGKIIGDTFQCIQRHQFKNLRDGDRFYYERPGVFTPEQLAEIKKMTISKVLCDTLKGIVSIQKESFKAYRPGTRRVTCYSVPGMDLNAWANDPDH